MTLSQRHPRQRDPRFLAFVRTAPCVICGGKAEAAHIRMACPERGKPFTGAGKPSDCFCTPLCAYHHRTGPQAQHVIGERAFWKLHGLDPFVIAEKLYAIGGHPKEHVEQMRKAKPRRAKRKSAPMPGTRKSGLKRKFSGQVVHR